MGLIKKQVREEKQTISLRLEVGVIDMLTKYAEYLEGSKDYVVTAALKYVCGRDADFQAHLQTQGALEKNKPKERKVITTHAVPPPPSVPIPQVKS